MLYFHEEYRVGFGESRTSRHAHAFCFDREFQGHAVFPAAPDPEVIPVDLVLLGDQGCSRRARGSLVRPDYLVFPVSQGSTEARADPVCLDCEVRDRPNTKSQSRCPRGRQNNPHPTSVPTKLESE